jgi:hypothetical protein
LPGDSEIGKILRGFFGRRAVRVFGVVALLVVVVVLLFLLLNWYVAPAEPGASVRKDLVLAVAQILGGTALLSGLYFTWRTLQVNREGQITERFTRAIDQLGKVEDGQKLFEIRVGGIYALERIARESEEDYWPIMEILTAYVRSNAPWPPEVGQESTEDATDEQRVVEGSGGDSETTEPSALDPDIQAIMTILRRRSRSYYGKGEPEPLDLSDTNLSGTNLSGANLSGANLSGANLSGARLFKAVLHGADFSRTNLSGAHLSGARFFEAILWRANLWSADLSEADLSGAYLSRTNLSEADLRGADLSEAAYLTQEQLEKTTGDETTKLPSDLEPPAHWGVKTYEQTEGE